MLLLILSIADAEKRDILIELYMGYRVKGLVTAFHFVQNHYTAEEIVEDAYHEIIMNPDALQFDTAERNWPYIEVIIKNKCKNHLRKENRIQFFNDYSGFEDNEQIQHNDLDIAELLSRRELFEKAVNAILALPDIYKDAILLRYDNELSNQEISMLLGISSSAVRVRIHRALAMLQAQLKGGDDNAA